MPSPYDSLIGLSHDPFGDLLRGGGLGRRPPAVPDLPPEEQDALLGNLTETSLGGLAYLGKVADKTFGARAVRGLLAGRPEELLSVLPFSDTIGDLTEQHFGTRIGTAERNAVQGTDLLAHYGLITPGDDSWQNLAAGFAAEVLLDPSTYIGLGPLTRAGKLAEKAGALPRGLASGMRGFDVAESAIKPPLQAGQRLQDVVPLGKTVLPEALEQAGVATGEPLRAMFGLGLPFAEPAITFGTGPTAQKVAGALGTAASAPFRGLDWLGDATVGIAPTRALRAALDYSVRGATSREGQELASDFFTPELRRGLQAVDEQAIGYAQRAAPLLGDDRLASQNILREAAEGYTDAARGRAAAAGSPDELVGLGGDMGEAIRGFRTAETADGLTTQEWVSMLDQGANYYTRTKSILPRQPGEGLGKYTNRLTKEFSTTHASQIGRLKMFDVPGGTAKIQEWSTSPEMFDRIQRARAASSELELQGFFRQELTGNAARSADDAINEQANRLANWAVRLPDAHFIEKIPFFRPDPIADFQLRGHRSVQARTSAETVYEGVRRFAGKTDEMIASGDTDLVAVPDLLARLKLSQSDAWPSGTAADRIAAARLGLANLNKLKDYSLKAEVARDIIKIGEAWKNPRELTPMLQAWDWASNLFKTWVTVPFAAFHVRNLMSGLFNMWRGDVPATGLLPALGKGYSIVRGGLLEKPLPGFIGATKEEWTAELVREAAARDIAFTRSSGRAADTAPDLAASMVSRLPTPGGSGQSTALGRALGLDQTLVGDLMAGVTRAVPTSWEQANPFNIAGVNRLDDTNSFVAEMRKVQGTLDDWLQLSHYMALREQGYVPDAARLVVKKYHNDYQELSNTERNVLKRVFPWYSFSRRSLPAVLEDFATKPAKVATATRLVSGVRTPFEFVPAYVGEGASIPIPGAPEGQQRYISSFGLPIEDESFKALGSLAHGDVTRGLQTVLGMAQPAVKAPLEQAFGSQLYSGRKLDELRALSAINQSGLFDERDARLLSQILANTPASRFATTLNQFLDERKGTGPTAFNTLTGIRVQDVDAERQRDIAARELLEARLRGRPGVRVHDSIYVPAEKLPLMDPLEYQLYRSYRTADKAVQKRSAERRKEREAAPAPPR
ncbi:MAG TPA: hypothetical protein VFG68_19015 [Fimbriiglobus sp.]|nr:hypothetical protein [Fimbriiglobus sp.]